MKEDIWPLVRRSIIGRHVRIRTPFGTRRITYADFTASGRGVAFIEGYITRVMTHYANTHTEDGATGTITTGRLRQAEQTIKRLVHAGPEYKIIEAGSGATAAVHRLQQILGVYIPPVAKDIFRGLAREHLSVAQLGELESHLLERRPVVFVGPYEHHSNEVSWRECFAEVVVIDLNHEGLLDFDDLDTKLSRLEYQGRQLIGAFSAASNVSGVVTPVHEVARTLHGHGATAFFDYAAIAPYADIDMCRDAESYFDGIYFSPHKFLGGPGSSGVLIIHEKVYRADLPPTIGAGGTVDYVSRDGQSYTTDIEAREKPGTPGILQIMRAALAMELKERLDPRRIAVREKELIHGALARFGPCRPIEIMGNPDPDNRIAIFSFNIRAGESYLHPRFVTMLLNDLFGIQCRAGCSCAGPYGHRMLHIDGPTSQRFRDRVAHGFVGLKPGWTRISFHYLMTDAEYEFILDAICFVCECGKYFLPLYDFDIHTGNWRHRGFEAPEIRFGLDDALREPEVREPEPVPPSYEVYLKEARAVAERLKDGFDENAIRTTEKDLIPFAYMGKEER